MKQRLRGLLALIICFILTVAPISGAMADYYYDYDEEGNLIYIELGDLISSNTFMNSDYSGGAKYYKDGLYDSGIQVTPEYCYISPEVEGTSDYKANLWAVAGFLNYENYEDIYNQEGYSELVLLERVGKFVHEIDFSECTVLYFDKLIFGLYKSMNGIYMIHRHHL